VGEEAIFMLVLLWLPVVFTGLGLIVALCRRTAMPSSVFAMTALLVLFGIFSSSEVSSYVDAFTSPGIGVVLFFVGHVISCFSPLAKRR